MEYPQHLLVVCPKCRARVQAKILGTSSSLYHAKGNPKDITGGKNITLSQCSSCGLVMTAIQKLGEYREPQRGRSPVTMWMNAERVWPEAQSALSQDIPSSIRDSLLEAIKCLD